MFPSICYCISFTRSNTSLPNRVSVPRARFRIQMDVKFNGALQIRPSQVAPSTPRSCPSLTHFFIAMAGGTPHPYKALPRRPPVIKFNERWTCSSLSDLPSRAYYPQVSVEACLLTCCAAVSTNKIYWHVLLFSIYYCSLRFVLALTASVNPVNNLGYLMLNLRLKTLYLRYERSLNLPWRYFNS